MITYENRIQASKYICTIDAVKSVHAFKSLDEMLDFMIDRGGDSITISETCAIRPTVRLSKWNRGRIIYGDDELTREAIATILQLDENTEIEYGEEELKNVVYEDADGKTRVIPACTAI